MGYDTGIVNQNAPNQGVEAARPGWITSQLDRAAALADERTMRDV
jgi:hypothetical protein